VNSVICGSVDKDEAFARLGSRLETFAVIDLHSWAEAGRASISINSRSQSFAASSACSDPNDCVTALKNADSSRSAIVIVFVLVMRSEQGWLEFFDGS
jgi:hypothetical protein